jgi:hypothetical protein
VPLFPNFTPLTTEAMTDGMTPMPLAMMTAPPAADSATAAQGFAVAPAVAVGLAVRDDDGVADAERVAVADVDRVAVAVAGCVPVAVTLGSSGVRVAVGSRGVLVDDAVALRVMVGAGAVALADAVAVALAPGLADVDVGVASGVPTGQPPSARMTAVSSSEIVIEPSMFASPTVQLVTGASVSAMLTIVSSSLIVTWPSPLQSPTHAAGWIAVAVGVANRATQIGFVAHPATSTHRSRPELPSGSQPLRIADVAPAAASSNRRTARRGPRTAAPARRRTASRRASRVRARRAWRGSRGGAGCGCHRAAPQQRAVALQRGR